MFEAFFIAVKEVLLKPFLTISATFIKLVDIYTVILLNRINFNIAET